MNMIREMFPNAKIIIDRFHMVQNINRELNKARIKLMNQYKNKKGSIYTVLKNFWKVILEDRDKVNSTKSFYSRSFKRYVTRKEVLDYILAIDDEFTASYERVHEIREAIKARDSVELEKYIDMDTLALVISDYVILIISRFFVSEYKNNIKLKENKKKSKQQNAA